MLWLRPAPDFDRSQLGLIGRISEVPCLFDYFHASPSVNDVFRCMGKQLDRYRLLVREAEQAHGAAAKARVVVPPLWIMSPRLPKQTIRRLSFRPMEGWVSGIWEGPMPVWPVRLMVLSDLPETRDTLMLRILGRGKTFYRAVLQVHALPDDAWEAKQIIPSLVSCGMELLQGAKKGGALDEAEVQAIEAIIGAWQERAEQEGRPQQRQDDLCRIYQARFGALPSAVQAAVESMQDDHVLQQWIEPFAICTPEEIAALVLGG